MLIAPKHQARPDEPVRTGIETPAWMNQFGQGNPFFVGPPEKKDCSARPCRFGREKPGRRGAQNIYSKPSLVKIVI